MSQEHDPTRAYVKINTGSSDRWESVIASLDSGVRKEWISSHILRRFNDIEEVQLSSPEIYISFQGASYRASTGVVIRWHSDKNRISRQGLFRVVDNGPFDVIIGSDLLFSEGIYIFNEAALLFFHRAPKPDEEARMQQILAEQFADGQNYEANRREQQESARRQQRADLESRRIGGSPSYPVTSHGDSMTVTGSLRRGDIYEADRWGTGSDGYQLSPGTAQSYQQRGPYSPTATPDGTAQSYQQRGPYFPTATPDGTAQSYQQRGPYSPTATPDGTAQSYQQRGSHSPNTTAGTWQQQGESSRSNGLRNDADSRSRHYDSTSYYSPPEPSNRTYARASDMDDNTSWACPSCGHTNSYTRWHCSRCGNQKTPSEKDSW